MFYAIIYGLSLFLLTPGQAFCEDRALHSGRVGDRRTWSHVGAIERAVAPREEHSQWFVAAGIVSGGGQVTSVFLDVGLPRPAGGSRSEHVPLGTYRRTKERE